MIECASHGVHSVYMYFVFSNALLNGATQVEEVVLGKLHADFSCKLLLAMLQLVRALISDVLSCAMCKLFH